MKHPGKVWWIASALILLAGISMTTIPLYARERIEVRRLYAYPNPFDNEEEAVNITLLIYTPIDGLQGSINYFIYDMNGTQVWSRKNDVTLNKADEGADGSIRVENLWNGNNDRGQPVANGVYVCNVVIEIGGTYVKDARILVK